jgi:hypothetical protein
MAKLMFSLRALVLPAPATLATAAATLNYPSGPC